VIESPVPNECLRGDVTDPELTEQRDEYIKQRLAALAETQKK
jgi:hypothetical protein